MEYKVKGFIVRENNFSEVEKWINEMAKKGFEVDSLKTELFTNGQFAERVVVVVKKKEVVIVNSPLDIKVSPDVTEIDIAKAIQKEIAKTEEQKPKGKSKSKE